MKPRTRPVSRRRVVAGIVAGVAVLAGVITLAESLRHPHPGDDVTVAGLYPEDDDPRVEIVCEQAPPREGVPRDDEVEPAPAVTVTSGELYDCPDTWDGRRVRYEGEVIGAVLRRDGGAWVQLNDDAYADLPDHLAGHRVYRGGNSGVGVFIPPQLADQVTLVGGPGAKGDVLEVTGRFHRLDPISLEVAVIRADRGGMVQPGSPFEDPPLRDRELVAAALALMALGLVVAERRAARRRRLGRPAQGER